MNLTKTANCELTDSQIQIYLLLSWLLIIELDPLPTDAMVGLLIECARRVLQGIVEDEAFLPSFWVFFFLLRPSYRYVGNPVEVTLQWVSLALQWAVFYMPSLTCPYSSRQLPLDQLWPMVSQQMLLASQWTASYERALTHVIPEIPATQQALITFSKAEVWISDWYLINTSRVYSRMTETV